MIDLKKLLDQMTFEEKVGQLAQYNANVLQDTSADITGPRTHLGLSKEQLTYVGSVLNFQSPKEVRAIQDAHLAADRNKIPMIFMMDVIHGFRTIYPIPLALGCSFDTDLVGSNSQPVQRLIDFQKVVFAAHERKTLTFTVTEVMLRFWNNEHKFVSESGVFELSTGYADHLQHTKRFELV